MELPARCGDTVGTATATATVTAQGSRADSPRQTRGGDFHLATRGDFNLATRGDFHTATDSLG